jgi:hypothetical protein
MNRVIPPARAPSGITTLDLLLFTAGFACGWVMHRGSALRFGQFYSLPLSRGGFNSLLGTVWIAWLWASVIGLAFLIVGRRFRYDCRNRPAEWLAVALAIVLFESVYPAFRTERAGAMTGETAWIEPSAPSDSRYAIGNFRDRTHLLPGSPLTYDLWWPKPGESRTELLWIALQMTAAALLIAIAGWCLRARLSPGWVAVLAIVITVLVALGPIRLAEATSIDVSSSAPNPGYRPSAGEKPWSWPWVAAYFDARAWAGYSIRALALATLAMLAARSLLTRWQAWLWTEWAVLVCAAIIAGCWIYDEFVARPALDRTVRITLLGTWLLVTAVMPALLIWVWSSLGRRFHAPISAVECHP